MKNALVTGGSGGIGRAVALSLAKEGCAVSIHYSTNKESAVALVAEINSNNGKALAIHADLSQPDSARKLVSEASEQFGGIDILVNNAGLMTDFAIADMTDQDWDLVLEVNLSSAFKLTRECIPHMKANNWGRIISISSQVALTGSANHSHYAAAKAGLLGFTYSAAKELGAFGITVNAILPGRIETDMISQRSVGRMDEWMAQTPLKRLGKPDEIASVVSFIASNASSYITGAAINVNGGLVMG
ncbi:FabG Dehydrogenases with different specificities (related to short-chain alcohol dehydrogenases) [actinobacterium SCGC AAA044-D11]